MRARRVLLVFTAAITAAVGCGIHHGTAPRSSGFHGRVQDWYSEAPVSGATVTLLDGDRELSRSTSAPDGTFSITGSGTRLHLRVTAAGYAEQEANVKAGRIVVPMDVGTTIRGVVYDGRRRQPVEGAKVSCLRGMVRESAPILTAADGRFVLEHCDRTITVFKDGYAFTVQSWGSVVPGDTLSGAIRLDPGVPVTGRVVDESGHPVAGADVLAFYSTINPSLGATGWARTDDQGRFAMQPLTPSDRTFIAFREGGPIAIERRRLSGPTEVDLTLPDARILKGRVRTASGAAVDHARVSVSVTLKDEIAMLYDGVRRKLLNARGYGLDPYWKTGWSREDGSFEMGGLWAGRASVRVAHPIAGHAIVTSTGGGDVSVVLTSGGSIEGVIVDTAGRPTPHDGNLAMMPPWRRGATTMMGWTEFGAIQEGRFHVDGLEPGLWNFDVQLDHGGGRQSGLPAIISSGRVTHVSWIVSTPGSVHGRIVDSRTHQPVGSVGVSADFETPSAMRGTGGLLYFTGGQDVVDKVYTDAFGRFRIQGVRGTVNLRTGQGSRERGPLHHPTSVTLKVPDATDVDAGDITVDQWSR